ncbi:MAG: hypothetical protein ACE5OP_04020 [Candidatus Glassbacteria bacterium]
MIKSTLIDWCGLEQTDLPAEGHQELMKTIDAVDGSGVSWGL